MSHIPLLGKKIENSKKILLINHIRMDPDAFGSLAGFYQILQKLGKNVIAVNDDSVPENFGFLAHNHIIETNLNINNFKPDLIISFDASSLDQLGKQYSENIKIFQDRDFFVIDHHLSNPGFGKYNIIKTDYSSTCEIVFEIIEELNYLQYIDTSIASCLFTGLITDTNIFYNQNTTPNTHRIAGELMTHGADFRAPIFEFYKKKSLKKSRLWGEILRNLKQIEKNGKIITYALVGEEDFEKTGTTSDDTSGLINEFLSNMEDSDVCFLLYPLKEGLIKASFRSKKMNVSKICQKYGGGGHNLAAGCSVNMTMDEFEKEILDNF